MILEENKELVEDEVDRPVEEEIETLNHVRIQGQDLVREEEEVKEETAQIK